MDKPTTASLENSRPSEYLNSTKYQDKDIMDAFPKNSSTSIFVMSSDVSQPSNRKRKMSCSEIITNDNNIKEIRSPLKNKCKSLVDLTIRDGDFDPTVCELKANEGKDLISKIENIESGEHSSVKSEASTTGNKESDDGDSDYPPDLEEDEHSDDGDLDSLSDFDDLLDGTSEIADDYDIQTSTLLSHLRKTLGLPDLKMSNNEEKQIIASVTSAILSGTKLLTCLREWFPHLPNDYLQGISESHAINRNDAVAKADLYWRIFNADDTIINNFLDANGIQTQTTKFPFVRIRLFPRQQSVSDAFNLELDNLFRSAKDEYDERYRVSRHQNPNVSQSSYSTAPDLEYIDYIYNPEILDSFEATKERFELENIPTDEKRLFHGTHQNCTTSIISGNFDVEAAPIGRSKGMAYGKGIYFSDFPSFSYKYGTTLLMCRVLPGRMTNNRLTTNNGPSPQCISPSGSSGISYQSFQQMPYTNRLSPQFKKQGNKMSQIYVIPQACQILPCYILYRKDSTDASKKSLPLCFSHKCHHACKNILILGT